MTEPAGPGDDAETAETDAPAADDGTPPPGEEGTSGEPPRRPRRGPRRAARPATNPRTDDAPDVVPPRDAPGGSESERDRWLREQRPPHWE